MSHTKQQRNTFSPLQVIGLTSILLIANWGIVVAMATYFQMEFAAKIVHIPFWLMVGSIGVLLNYLPIAKSKPPTIPILGIVSVVATTFRFSLNNYLELNGGSEIFERIQIDVVFVVVCYCLTHLSLLLLTYRDFSMFPLLAMASVAVIVSGIAYVVLFSGMLNMEVGLLVVLLIGCLFFAKMALTLALAIWALTKQVEPVYTGQ